MPYAVLRGAKNREFLKIDTFKNLYFENPLFGANYANKQVQIQGKKCVLIRYKKERKEDKKSFDQYEMSSKDDPVGDPKKALQAIGKHRKKDQGVCIVNIIVQFYFTGKLQISLIIVSLKIARELCFMLGV